MIAVIDYGAGNVRSIQNALKKLGATAKVVDSPKQLSGASHIILPGVGSFGAAMERLEPFRKPLRAAVDSGTPFLGLCLGIQVIFEESEESPGVRGLGLLSGTCRRFPKDVKVPHMGWNTIEKKKETQLLDGIPSGTYFYFVHSYYPLPKNHSITACETDYGNIKFPSVISEGNIHATQFHPERSGEQGLKLLENFLNL
jgi:glutamine amidotransferase